jgi:hypothetical protein
MKATFAFALTSCCAFAAVAPIREVVSACPESSGVPICQIRYGWSIKFDSMNNRVPLVYGPDGLLRFPLSFQLAGTEVSYAYDLAPDADGSFVVAGVGGAADMRQWQKSGLVLFDSNGVQTAFIDTGDFRCAHVVIASDHSVWALGSEYTGMKERVSYAILRKYSRTGELLGSFLDRSTFPPGLGPGGPSPSAALFTAGDRIAVMAYSGNVGNERELIELDLDGKVLGRMRFDMPQYHWYAFTSTGGFYAGPMGPSPTILQLNPATNSTREVESPGRPWTLSGADGPNLLYRSVTQDSHLKIAWFPPPAD